MLLNVPLANAVLKKAFKLPLTPKDKEVLKASTVTRRAKPAPRKAKVGKRASGKSRGNSCASGGSVAGKRTSDGGNASEQKVLALLDKIDESLIRLGLEPLD